MRVTGSQLGFVLTEASCSLWDVVQLKYEGSKVLQTPIGANVSMIRFYSHVLNLKYLMSLSLSPLPPMPPWIPPLKLRSMLLKVRLMLCSSGPLTPPKCCHGC